MSSLGLVRGSAPVGAAVVAYLALTTAAVMTSGPQAPASFVLAAGTAAAGGLAWSYNQYGGLTGVAIGIVALSAAFADLPRLVGAGPVRASALLSIGLVVAAVGVVTVRGVAREVAGPVAVMAAVVAVGIVVAASRGAPGQELITNTLAMIAFPLAIAVGATAARDRGSLWKRQLDRAFAILPIAYYVSRVAFWVSGTSIGGGRAFAIAALPAVAWGLCHWREHGMARRFLTVAAALVPFVSLSRTAVVAAALMWIAWAVVSSGRRLGRIVAIAIVGIVGVLVLYPTEAVQSRLYRGDTENVGGITLNVSGRGNLWHDAVLEFRQHPVLGGGVGAADVVISERSLGRLEHVHNDYLHLLVDFGIVGTGLWVASVLVLLRRLVARRGSPVAGAAALALIGAAAMGVTDNPMVYGFVTAPIGLLVGVALAGPRVAQR